jgi:hypothetical protein
MTFSLGFYNGALRDANDARARDISERINAHIDAALLRARSEEIGNQLNCLPDLAKLIAKLSLRISIEGHQKWIA